MTRNHSVNVPFHELFLGHAAAVPRLVLNVLMFAIALLAALPSRADTTTKAVLVTGASTGIGRKIAERLARDGYLVYAGARKESDIMALNAIKNVHGILLDVTSPEDISEAFATISREGHGLYGLVNNAGLTSFASVAAFDAKEFDQLMAVNVEGPVRMAQAFAPLITSGKGRIVNVGSTMGTYSVADMSIYCMTKFAIEAFTESLDQEMAPLGIKVSVIEPGTYRSQIDQNQFKRRHQEVPAALISQLNKLKEPDDVAAAAERALFEPNPKRRYLVVPAEDQHAMVIKAQIQKLVELNEGQPYTYDRATLVRLLDESLSHARPRIP